MENNLPSSTKLDELKSAIAEISAKPLDTHSLEFEKIHSDLNNILSEIDGL
jgi:hypothetical protein